MADLAQKVRSHRGARQEPHEVHCHDQARDRRAEALGFGPHTEQRVLQTVARHQQRDANEQGSAAGGA